MPPTYEPAALDEPTRVRFVLVYSVVALGMLMGAIDQSIVATALPAIGHDLGARVNWTGWTITIYSLGRMVVLPVAGRLSDQFGSRNVFIASGIVFVLASLGCGLATNIYTLVAIRLLQAAGGGAFMPAGTGVLTATFPQNRDRAVGSLITIFSIGGLIGPALGGIFVEYWSWRGIFFVNVPLGAVMLALAVKVLPKTQRKAGTTVDAAGLSIMSVTLITGMLCFALIGEAGTALTDPRPWLLGAASAGFGALFVRHAKRAKAPFIAARLLYKGSFGVMNVINFLYGCTALGFGTLVPLYARERYGISALASATLLSARAIGVFALSTISTFTLRRTGYRRPMVVGYLIVALGMAASAIAPLCLTPLNWLVITTALVGVGVGVATPASNNASMQLAREDTSTVAGLRAMVRQAGTISAVSLVTAVLARSSSPGLAQAHLIVAFAIVLVLALPLIRKVPEHFGAW